MENTIFVGDAEFNISKHLPDKSVNMCVTSPPYFGLRDYGNSQQIGMESTPDKYVARLVGLFREVRRALRDDGTLWVNIGDSYATTPGKGSNVPQTKWKSCSFPEGAPHQSKPIPNCKPKDLIGIPWMLAFALRADGWYLRQSIIWAKGNPMPESVQDRCTRSHESIFMFSKKPKYYYDSEAIKEPCVEVKPRKVDPDSPRKSDKQRGHSRRHDGFNDRWDKMEKAERCSGLRNKRDVWTVGTRPYLGAHFATFPPKLIEPCILAGCPVGGIVLDPFMGSGTTGEVAYLLGRNYFGFELNPDYAILTKERIEKAGGPCRIWRPIPPFPSE